MPDIQLPGIRLYYEELGSGVPILLIHGTGSDAGNMVSAAEELASLGRVIIYDRRGCTRSERPDPYDFTTPSEHAGDAAALLDALDATPAIIVGRSYGGEVALQLALHNPEHVRALVLLEGGGLSLSPEALAFNERLTDPILAAVAERGPAAAGEALLRGVLDEADFQAMPEDMKARIAANGPAIVAETKSFRHVQLDPARLNEITCPALVVAASSSPPAFRQLSETLAATLPNARLAQVEGGHIISPAEAQVMDFIREVRVPA